MPDRIQLSRAKPIIFSAPMVQALLAGRKTQTRRLLNLRNGIIRDRSDANDCVRFFVGDRLYVREAHYLTDDGDEECAVYAGDTIAAIEHFDAIRRMQKELHLSDEWAAPHLRLRPPIHMPRWASRLTLALTDVWVHRLNDISEADAVAEGCLMDPEPDEYGNHMPAEIAHERGGDIGWDCARDWFADLWDRIHGPNAWDANPWVVAVSFDVQHGNVDQLKAGANNA